VKAKQDEYNLLADKRDTGKLTEKEYKRWVQLVNESFADESLKIVKTWAEGFGNHSK